MLVAIPGAVAASTSATTQPPPPGGIGVRLLPAPDAPKSKNPLARVYIVDRLGTGTTIQRTIAVSNTTKSSQKVSLYAGGAEIANQVFVPGPNNALSSWIEVTPSSVLLRPGTAQKAEVTIAVPPKASLGERYAVVWAQVALPGSVVQINRVGVRVYLDVENVAPPGGASSVEPWVIGGTSAAVVAVLVGGGLLLYRRRNRRPAIPQQTKPTPSTQVRRQPGTT
jgi:hypothetical protein